MPGHTWVLAALPTASVYVVLQVVGRIVLEVELLLPLVRVALTCLTVDSLQLLQAQAVGKGPCMHHVNVVGKALVPVMHAQHVHWVTWSGCL